MIKLLILLMLFISIGCATTSPRPQEPVTYSVCIEQGIGTMDGKVMPREQIQIFQLVFRSYAKRNHIATPLCMGFKHPGN